jgi:hypothetical protein
VRSRSELTAPTPPPLAGRIHYLVGGMLAPSELEWVRQDLTGAGWRHRQAGRQVLLMLPVAIAFAFLPGQASVRVSIPLGLLLIAVVMGYTTGEYFRNRRLDQYGIERPKPVEEDAYLDYEPLPTDPAEPRQLAEPSQLAVGVESGGPEQHKPRAGEPDYDPEDE